MFTATSIIQRYVYAKANIIDSTSVTVRKDKNVNLRLDDGKFIFMWWESKEADKYMVLVNNDGSYVSDGRVFPRGAWKLPEKWKDTGSKAYTISNFRGTLTVNSICFF